MLKLVKIFFINSLKLIISGLEIRKLKMWGLRR
jgi:hypothetical protein